MLNTKKFLYILPDAAYIAELLPTKKPHTFAIQAFRQINGTFIDENEFLADNIDKLIKKIEPEEYQVILPDFLFTNTIVDVAESSETSLKKYLQETLLPSLDLRKETHEIETFVLTQHQGKYKVQLSALEKSLLAPLQKATEEQKIKITNISPLSWTIKSVISLEPSLSTIQIGGMLYLAFHYIGVDQTISFTIEETANIIETVKTLKGGEPNIQTMYLLTNALIENDIKEKLSGTLPIQQLASYVDEQEGIPSYIKQIIESAAKTFDIPEYPVPKFPIGKFTGTIEPAKPLISTTEEPVSTPPITTTVAENEKKEETKSTELPNTPIGVIPKPSMPLTDLPAPKFPTTPTAPTPVSPMPTVSTSPVSAPAEEKKPSMPQTSSSTFHQSDIVSQPTTQPLHTMPITHTPTLPTTPVAPTVSTPPSPPRFAPPGMSPAMGGNPMSPRPVIKNKGSGSMMKVIGVTLGALIVTVALGIAIGFAILKLSEKKGNALDHSPVVQVSASPSPIAQAPSPSPVALPSPSPTTTVSKATLKILVVNATKTSGLAGKVKTTLTSAGYKSVQTGNAKGAYSQAGDFALMDTNNTTLLSMLQKDSKLTLTYNAGKSTEDSQGTYDAVIVLNQ